MTIFDLLRRDEDKVAVPYQDSKGIWTVGYGHKMTNPLPDYIVESLFQYDVHVAEDSVRELGLWTMRLSECRRAVLVAMAFQLGGGGLRGFKRMLAACEAGDYATAAAEMLDSAWARNDSPARAHRMASQMEYDVWH